MLMLIQSHFYFLQILNVPYWIRYFEFWNHQKIRKPISSAHWLTNIKIRRGVAWRNKLTSQILDFQNFEKSNAIYEPANELAN